MSASLFEEYNNAVARGDYNVADTLADVIRIGGEKYPGEFQTWTGLNTPTTSKLNLTVDEGSALPNPDHMFPGLPSLSKIAGGALGVLGTPITGLAGGSWNPFTNAKLAGDAAENVTGAATSAANFITDLPRMATVLIGAVLIVVGLAALVRQPIILQRTGGNE